MPRIAVIIPVHNREEVVRRAIDSVLRQDFRDFELVVVDDGSTDRTPEVVAAIDDPRITLLRQSDNRGGNAARNLGVKATTAPIIAFLDSDDEYLPHKLSTIIGMFDDAPDIDLVLDSFMVQGSDADGEESIDRINPVIDNSGDFLSALLDSAVTSRRLWISTSAITVRRSVAIRVDLFDERLRCRQEMEFMARVAKTGRCVATNRRLWIKHKSSDSVTAKREGYIDGGYVDATILMCRRHPEYLSNPMYRAGLAHDLVRHLWKSLEKLRWRQLASGVRLLLREFGAIRFIRLVGRGIVLLVADWCADSILRRSARSAERRDRGRQILMSSGQGADHLAGEDDRGEAERNRHRRRDLPQRQCDALPLRENSPP
jgi:glycosyltransferase involved in cell wall biosynthesis